MAAPPKTKGRPPCRAKASEEALAGTDPSTCNPVLVLQRIALDTSAPHSARVSAAKALLKVSTVISKPPSKETIVHDRATARALELLAQGRAN